MMVQTEVMDFHNHVVPGVDDGARNIADARAALTALESSGVRCLVATPHVDASVASRRERFDKRMRELDAGWAALEELVAESFRSLEVWRGAEVRLDVPDPDLTDARLRLGGGRFALVEFPFFTVPPRSARVLAHLRERGWVPILAHPERYDAISADVQLLQEWRAAGAFLQVNGPSLTGRYGKDVRERALALITHGWADYLSSDYHARGATGIEAYRTLLNERGGEGQAELMLWTNPRRLLEGAEPIPVPPLATRRGLWDRIASAFR